MSSANPMHVLIVDNYLSHTRGGISTTSSRLANGMATRGHRITLYTEERGKTKSLYPLHDAVAVRTYRFTDNNLAIQALREEVRALDPDVCVPLFPDGQHLVWAVTLLGSGIPLLYSERHSPRTIENEYWTRKGRWAALSGADRIHVLLPEFVKSVPDFARNRVRVIPNAAPAVNGRADPAGMDGRCRLLWLARLQEPVKQCGLAMDAFARLVGKYPEWDMHVVGDGPDKKRVYAHAASLGLGRRLVLHGGTDDPFSHYLNAQAFCLSSRTEGMPNTLLEALACGLPAVGFRGCEGVGDLIKDGWNGWTAEEMSSGSLAASLEKLFRDADARREMGENARSVRETYAEQACLDAWEELLRETAACKGNTVMDSFAEEPFASMARLSSAARREWLWRDFGMPVPGSFEYYARKCRGKTKRFFKKIGEFWRMRFLNVV